MSYRKKSPEYLRNAAACRKLAKGARAASEQATYCELAQHWEGMAEIENRIIATLSAITADISRAA